MTIFIRVVYSPLRRVIKCHSRVVRFLHEGYEPSCGNFDAGGVEYIYET